MNVYYSLKTVSEMLEDRGFNTDKINVDENTAKIMEKKNKIEFLISKKDSDEICCVKYMLQKIRPTLMKNTLDELIDKYELKPSNSTLILVLGDSPGQTVEKVVNSKIVSSGYFIQLFLMKNLVFNITKHIAVPKHRLLSSDEAKQLMQNLKLKNKQQLPIILKNDPIAKYYGMHSGDICEIKRYSITAGNYIAYRYCR